MIELKHKDCKVKIITLEDGRLSVQCNTDKKCPNEIPRKQFRPECFDVTPVHS